VLKIVHSIMLTCRCYWSADVAIMAALAAGCRTELVSRHRAEDHRDCAARAPRRPWWEHSRHIAVDHVRPAAPGGRRVPQERRRRKA